MLKLAELLVVSITLLHTPKIRKLLKKDITGKVTFLILPMQFSDSPKEP